MQISYDTENGILYATTNARAATSASLLNDAGIVVDLATPDGPDIVGLMVMGASAYIPLGKGYVAETDTLFLGATTDDAAFITETGDFVGYWQEFEGDTSGDWDPIGVALRQASKHLASVIEDL